MFQLSDSQKLWLKTEALSIFHTMLTFFVIDGASALMQLWNGDWGKMLWYELGVALLRSFIKAILQESFPSLFKRQ